MGARTLEKKESYEENAGNVLTSKEFLARTFLL